MIAKQFTLGCLTSVDEMLHKSKSVMLVDKVTIFDWSGEGMARMELSAPDGRYTAVLFPAQSLWVWHEVELP